MDFATIIGLAFGTLLISVSIFFGGNAGVFMHWPSLLIMVGGTITAVMIHFPLKQIQNGIAVVRKCFQSTPTDIASIVNQFREFAATARRGGVKTLQRAADEETDPFLRSGLEMAADGCNSAELISALNRDTRAVEQRHLVGRRLFEVMGSAAPAWGMIGTLMGLVQMLRHLEDPRQIGTGLAMALLTTLYGALFANLFCIPLAGKLESRHAEELMRREVILEGFVALLEEHGPTVVEGRLRAWVPPVERDDTSKRAKAS